jgi:hypothetical protein
MGSVRPVIYNIALTGQRVVLVLLLGGGAWWLVALLTTVQTTDMPERKMALREELRRVAIAAQEWAADDGLVPDLSESSASAPGELQRAINLVRPGVRFRTEPKAMARRLSGLPAGTVLFIADGPDVQELLHKERVLYVWDGEHVVARL